MPPRPARGRPARAGNRPNGTTDGNINNGEEEAAVQALRIADLEAANSALEAQLTRQGTDAQELQRRLQAMAVAAENAAPAGLTNEQVEALQRELEQTKESNAALQAKLDAAKEAGLPNKLIVRPAGVVGVDFSLEMGMGLAGSAGNHKIFLSCRRVVRRVVLNANIDVLEMYWPSIPARKKSDMFKIINQHMPIMAMYVNDWAATEMIKIFLSGQRKSAVSNGDLEAPASSERARRNSHQRGPGNRFNRAKKYREDRCAAGEEETNDINAHMVD